MQEAGPLVLVMRKMVERKWDVLTASRQGGGRSRRWRASCSTWARPSACTTRKGPLTRTAAFTWPWPGDRATRCWLTCCRASTPPPPRTAGPAVAFYNDERLFRLHERICEAGRRGDPKAARASVEDHMRAIQNVETVLAKGGLDG